MKKLSVFFVLLFSLSILSCGGGGDTQPNHKIPAPDTGGKNPPDGGKNPPDPGGSITLISVKWDVPSTRMNGNTLALSEINGFKIYLATNNDSIPNVPLATITDSTVTSYTITNLSSGTYYIYVTTYDVNGNESPHSDPITTTL